MPLSSQPPKPKVMLGDPFIQALIAAEIVPERCVRVVIDAEAGRLTYVHYAIMGDERLVKVIPAAAQGAVVLEEPIPPDPTEPE